MRLPSDAFSFANTLCAVVRVHARVTARTSSLMTARYLRRVLYAYEQTLGCHCLRVSYISWRAWVGRKVRLSYYTRVACVGWAESVSKAGREARVNVLLGFYVLYAFCLHEKWFIGVGFCGRFEILWLLVNN